MKRIHTWLFALFVLALLAGCGDGGESDAEAEDDGSADVSGHASIQELAADLDAPQEVISMFVTYMEAFEAGDCEAVADAGYSGGSTGVVAEREIEKCEERVRRYSHYEDYLSTKVSEEIQDNRVVIIFNRKYSESKEQQAVFDFKKEGEGWKINTITWADFST